MHAKFVDYCRPLKLWRERALVLFFSFITYAFKFQEARFYWLVNNGYYARRRIPTFKDSIGRYLELKGNGARRDGTTTMLPNKRVGEGEETREFSSELLPLLTNFTGVLC